MATLRRKWLKAWDSSGGGPTADAYIDHPAPAGSVIEVDNLPLMIAPDPGGIAPRAGVIEYLVEPLATPVQHSPITNWNPGSPYPGPAARISDRYIDLDSAKWWGRTGQGRLVWSQNTEFGDMPPAIPQDMLQHIDNFQGFWGGYPSIARNRPASAGAQVPVFNPIYPTDLPEG